MQRDRWPEIIVPVLCVVTALLHLLGALLWRDSFWGVHFYAFLPPWLGFLALATVVASLPLARRLAAGWRALFIDTDGSERLGRPGFAGLLAAIAAALVCVMWLARCGHYILGDGSVLVVSLRDGEAFHPRQPLTALLQHGFHRTFGGLWSQETAFGFEPSRGSVAISSVTAGALALPALWLLARRLVSLGDGVDRTLLRPAALLVAVVLLAQGYVLLFFGYVENYSWYTAAIPLYLWLALRCLQSPHSPAALLAPAAALLLAVALHLSAALLAPSFIYLAAAQLSRRDSRRAALIDLGLGAIALVALSLGLARFADGYSLPGTLLEVARTALSGSEEHNAGYFLSALHWRDFWNEQWLIGPLGLMLFLPAVAATVAARRVTLPTATFLLVVGGCYFGASLVAGESNLGYPRNWDLLAPASLVLTAAGTGLLLLRRPVRVSPLPWLVVATVLSLAHTSGWIGVNASFDRSFERLKTLPARKGITETNVARWYIIQSKPTEARPWLEKALTANPVNNNAAFLLGGLLRNAGDIDRAVFAYGRAVAARPDKDAYRRELVLTLMLAERWADCLPHCEQLLNRPVVDPRIRALHFASLVTTGRSDDALRALDDLRRFAAADAENAETCVWTLVGTGDRLYAAGRPEEAFRIFDAALQLRPRHEAAATALAAALVGAARGEEALVVLRDGVRLNPDSEMLRANLGTLLYRLGKRDEARPHLETVLRTTADAVLRERMRAMLESR